MPHPVLSFLLAVVLGVCTTGSAQTYHDDSLAVVEILAANGIDSIPVTSISSISAEQRIATLYLAGRGLRELPSAIARLTGLTTLNIDRNELSVLPEAFGQLSNLTYLNASDNYLYTLPESFGDLQKLSTAYFIRNRFTGWPGVFESMPNLSTIDLGGNNLTILPDGIAAYPGLQRLYINDNYLTALPESFSTMEPEVVHVAGNALCSLSAALTAWLDTYDYYRENSGWKTYQSCDDFTLDSSRVRLLLNENGWNDVPLMNVITVENGNIVGIDLSPAARGGPLQKRNVQATGTLVLSDNLVYLKYLRSLNLSGNRLDSLPALLGEFCHLRRLDLSGNNLEQLPGYMTAFRVLDSLDLSGNRLAELPSDLEQWADLYDSGWQEVQQTTGTVSATKQRSSVTAIRTVRAPAGQLHIELELTRPVTGEAALYELSGRKVVEFSSRKFSSGKNILRLHEARISRGIYLFRLSGDNMSVLTGSTAVQ